MFQFTIKNFINVRPLSVMFAIPVFLFTFVNAQAQIPAALPAHSHEQQREVIAKDMIAPGTVMPRFAPEVPSASFTVGNNFTGSNFNQSGFTPPDTMGAVGPATLLN